MCLPPRTLEILSNLRTRGRMGGSEMGVRCLGQPEEPVAHTWEGPGGAMEHVDKWRMPTFGFSSCSAQYIRFSKHTIRLKSVWTSIRSSSLLNWKSSQRGEMADSLFMWSKICWAPETSNHLNPVSGLSAFRLCFVCLRLYFVTHDCCCKCIFRSAAQQSTLRFSMNKLSCVLRPLLVAKCAL